MSKEKRIHISGGKGFLGTNITRKLEKKYNISVSDIDDSDATGFTFIIVSHRMNTLKHCDRIYSLENGKLKLINNV